MLLGTDVGLGPSEFVLDGEWGPSSPAQKVGEEQHPGHFSTDINVAKRLDGSR